MLNKVILMGRLTADPELRQTPSNVAVLQFTVAVQRSYAAQGEERQSDFITCVAWRQTAEFISRFFNKGSMIAVEGELRTRTYDDKNGVKHYVTEVIVDAAHFCGSKSEQGTRANGYTTASPYQSAAPAQPQRDIAPNENDNASLSIGSLGDFEEILGDGELPF